MNEDVLFLLVVYQLNVDLLILLNKCLSLLYISLLNLCQVNLILFLHGLLILDFKSLVFLLFFLQFIGITFQSIAKIPLLFKFSLYIWNLLLDVVIFASENAVVIVDIINDLVEGV
jgi:hypothetical protein